MLFQPCSILVQGGLANGTGSMALCTTVRRTANIRKQGKFRLTSFTPPSCWEDQPSLFFPRQESCLRSPQRKSLLFSSHLTCAGEPPGDEERHSAPSVLPLLSPTLTGTQLFHTCKPIFKPFFCKQVMELIQILIIALELKNFL